MHFNIICLPKSYASKPAFTFVECRRLCSFGRVDVLLDLDWRGQDCHAVGNHVGVLAHILRLHMEACLRIRFLAFVTGKGGFCCGRHSHLPVQVWVRLGEIAITLAIHGRRAWEFKHTQSPHRRVLELKWHTEVKTRMQTPN